ncbi:MAG TPA: hypothetical protein VF502_09655, partial [Stellaceae bacterium]
MRADLDRGAAAAVFDGVVEQILEHLRQLVGVAQHLGRVGRQVQDDAHVARRGALLQRVGDGMQHLLDVDTVGRRHMLVHLDARQRQQIVDQPRHALRLLGHDGEEAVARRGVVARRAAQRLDESGERGERRPELVAGIGDEIGAQSLAALDRGQIVEREHGGGALGAVRPDRRQPRREMALDRRRDVELDNARRLALEHRVGGGEHGGMTHRQRQVAIEKAHAEDLVGGGVGAEDAAPLVEQDQRIGQRAQHRLRRAEL